MKRDLLRLSLALVLALLAGTARAAIDGVTGTEFAMTAQRDTVSTADGGIYLLWGYALAGERAQYPGPTLIVNQGDTVTIRLRNRLPIPVSFVAPGHAVTGTGGVPGAIGQEVPADNGATEVVYTFTATHAGTYMYHSGHRPELAIEMGLVGALIVRPAGFDPMHPTAYGHPDSAYDVEYLFLLTEMDPRIHNTIAFDGLGALDATDYLTSYFPVSWFINGRNAPDTMGAPGREILATQPYNAMPMMNPGQRLLMRVIGAGRDLHPFHHHGNHSRIIARDGRLLSSGPGAGADLSREVFTIQSVPGSTVDSIFTWTGQGLGWDIYGTLEDLGEEYVPHECNPDADGYDVMTREWCADHGKPFPVVLPEDQFLTFGGHWSGSPFMGAAGTLPPGEGGLNPNAGYTYMWHSHTEKEMVNYDIFPGGMMTMLMIEPHGSSHDM